MRITEITAKTILTLVKIMTSKQIRKLSVEKLSMCWVEAEFILIMSIGISAFFLLAANFIFELFASDSYVLDLKNPSIPSEGVLVFGIALVLLYVVYAPMYFGLKWCYYNASKGKITPINCLFDCCTSVSRWWKTVKLKVVTDVLKAVGLIPMAAVFAAEAFLYNKITAINDSQALKVLIIVLMLVSMLGMYAVYLMYSVRYTLIPYVFASDPDLPLTEIYRKGTEISDKNKLSMFRLKWSFVPMFITCITGFPVFFVMPIYSMSLSIAANAALSGKEISETNTNEKDRGARQPAASVSHAENT